MGWIDQMPKLMGVQAAGSAALYEAWRPASTRWTWNPSMRTRLRTASRPACRGTGSRRWPGGAGDGRRLRQGDRRGDPGRHPRPGAAGSGVFAEPAGAAAYAGLVQGLNDGRIDPNERVVVLSTGNGLKEIASARKSVSDPFVVDRDLADVKRVLAGR